MVVPDVGETFSILRPNGSYLKLTAEGETEGELIADSEGLRQPALKQNPTTRQNFSQKRDPLLGHCSAMQVENTKRPKRRQVD